jgi:hypothetical protein
MIKYNGLLSEEDVNTLARYNSECDRGLLHNEKWKKKMEELQNKYNLWLNQLQQKND